MLMDLFLGKKVRKTSLNVHVSKKINQMGSVAGPSSIKIA